MIFRSKRLVVQIFHRYHGTVTMKIALHFLFNIFTSEQAINMKLAPNRQQKNQIFILKGVQTFMASIKYLCIIH